MNLLNDGQEKVNKVDKILYNTLEYEKFSSFFEFTETSDQIKTIEQIESDLISGTPMDRLVVVTWFRKTEIV